MTVDEKKEKLFLLYLQMEEMAKITKNYTFISVDNRIKILQLRNSLKHEAAHYDGNFKEGKTIADFISED